jgi:Flp pilus assembly protein TadG
VKNTLRHNLGIGRCECGGAAIEFAIIGSLLVFGCIATLEFGRALYVLNELSYAADVAEREVLMDSEISDADLLSTVHHNFRGDADLMTVVLGEETVDGSKFRTLTINYPISLLIPYFSTKDIGLSVDRRTPIS